MYQKLEFSMHSPYSISYHARTNEVGILAVHVLQVRTWRLENTINISQVMAKQGFDPRTA